MPITDFHAKYYANVLFHSASGSRLEQLTGTLSDAQVDLNPHQIEAALFALRSPFSKGVIMGDEVGLGKTIEALIVMAQKWAEERRKILIIVPANLKIQWQNELKEKFYLPSVILDRDSYKAFIKAGIKNPFAQDEQAIICSYNFAYENAGQMGEVEWDLVVMDEAHKVRNAYKPDNIIGRTILETLDNREKLLLTATPLHNSLLELYGLSRFIDNYVFGDLDSFKMQFSFLRDEKSHAFDDLVARVRQFCIRTLRRQVAEYIKYTERKLITQEFEPTAKEQEFYDKFSAYLQRDKLWAIPNSGRPLISMVLWKLLASSSFAIAGTLEKLLLRLETMYERGEIVRQVKFKRLDDGVAIDTEEEMPTVKTRKLTASEMTSLKTEIEELRGYFGLARSITQNAKGDALLIALDKGFEKLRTLRAPQKTVIFTESRRTQEYIARILSESKYKNKYVLYYGGLPPKKQEEIKAAFTGTAQILIATESAAEGLNLQFCPMIINYDLPFNPQRIEQRIGRCHRYGQKHDVVVINFLNKNNVADQRVYELLCDKFQLFEGVFGASDGVLGNIDTLDFEKRVIEIYQTCRTAAEIERSFKELRDSLTPEIDSRIDDIRKKLLENFDDVVAERLKVNAASSREYLTKYDTILWELTRHVLRGKAEFDDESRVFTVTKNPYYDSRHGYKRYGGQYIFQKDAPLDVRYRPKCSLAQTIIFDALNDYTGRSGEVCFDLSGYAGKVSSLIPFIGKSGFMRLSLMEIQYLKRRERRLIFAGFCEDGKALTGDQMRRMFDLSGETAGGYSFELPQEAAARLDRIMQTEQSAVVNTLSMQDSEFFDEELTKLDKWAKDVKQSMEKTIKDMDGEITELRKQARKSARLEDRLAVEKQIKELESKRNQQRFDLYAEQDKIDKNKETLIAETQAKLKQNVRIDTVFTIKWRIV